jgi:thiamine biosynthesis lipoprotein
MFQRLEFRAMGCAMLAFIDDDSPVALDALHQVPDWFEEWEQALSRFREGSELNRLNRLAGLSVHVSEILWAAFQTALTAEQATGGLVTPTVLDAVVMAGYDRPFELSARDQIQLRTIPKGWAEVSPLSAVTWDESSRSIRLPPDVRLDLGGSAKGWAAHQAAERLAPYGSALVDAGGDIAITGLRADGERWLIGISDPFDQGADMDVLRLGRCGVATSGKDRRRWLRDGVLSHHIIDPRTGFPAETDVMTATVIAPTVMVAEAAAKAALILGAKAGLDWIESDPSLSGVLILDDGSSLYSRGMEKYL